MATQAADGSLNVTVVSGSTYVGAMAPDGSLNVVDTNGLSWVGRVHPSGAINVVLGNTFGVNHKTGALVVSTSPYVSGTQRVTIVSGNLGTNNLYQEIQGLGLTTGLQFSLDAGSADSYTSGQSWLDLSGNGQDFFRGTDNTAQASDPTFNGVAGALTSSEYFSFDGGDWFTYDTTNEAWMVAAHKDNALLTVFGWVYPATTSSEGICGTSNNTQNDGFHIGKNSSNQLNFLVRNAAATSLSIASAETFDENAWNCFAVGITEAGGTNASTLFLNGVHVARTATYTSPANNNPSATFGIGARTGGGLIPLANGGRMAMISAWNTRLTNTQITALFNATRNRFGI